MPFPSPADLPDPGTAPAAPGLAGGFFTTEPSGKPEAAVVGGYSDGSRSNGSRSNHSR